MPIAERSAAARIDEALARVDPAERVTVTAVCRQAGISRNALYRFHPEALQRIRQLQQTHRPTATDVTTIRDLRAELTQAQALTRHLTALVDHYAAACREAHELLARRDRELAELRRSRRSSPTALRRLELR
jgi:hypothetical protein